jgi:hypothetical protein
MSRILRQEAITGIQADQYWYEGASRLWQDIASSRISEFIVVK